MTSDVLLSARWSVLFVAVFAQATAAAEDWPDLPSVNAVVDIPAQEWPQRPGRRTVRILIHYPGGLRENVRQSTGIMLSLHNWGGSDCIGTADPKVLADQLDVIAVCVNYLQSGRADSIDAPEPYDCGYLQALDALRALWYVRDQLKQQGTDYDDGRLYCTGGSGGGNVTLMANKLAPRTFACVIDICGMKKLSDDIAFSLPGGSDLNARWNRDPGSPNFLSADDQEIRFVAHPQHLSQMKQLGTECRIVVVHGVDDTTCPFEDAEEMVGLMKAHGLQVEAKWVSRSDLQGGVFTGTGHSLGDRTQIVLEMAGHYLRASDPRCLRRSGATDFDRREIICYPTTNGQFCVSWENGYPVAQFAARSAVPEYSDHTDIFYWMDDTGQRHGIASSDDWLRRRQHVVRSFERVAGPFPSAVSRVPLKVQVIEETRLEPPLVKRAIIRRKLTYQSDGNDRVAAWLLIPVSDGSTGKALPRPAVLCLQQTTAAGKDEPAGIAGDPTMKYALELSERGFVTLAPDYPSFGEHAYGFETYRGYASGSMKAVWDNVRAVDLLQDIPEVDGTRIGCIGHSLGGHSSIFTGLFEPRLKVIVSSCGFTGLKHDDLPSWAGPRYFPRIAAEFENRIERMPFDFHELTAALAPRPVLVCAAQEDSDFSVSGVREVVSAAAGIYRLLGAEHHLQAVYPPGPHAFPDDTRMAAFRFLEEHLGLTSN